MGQEWLTIRVAEDPVCISIQGKILLHPGILEIIHPLAEDILKEGVGIVDIGHVQGDRILPAEGDPKRGKQTVKIPGLHVRGRDQEQIAPQVCKLEQGFRSSCRKGLERVQNDKVVVREEGDSFIHRGNSPIFCAFIPIKPAQESSACTYSQNLDLFPGIDIKVQLVVIGKAAVIEAHSSFYTLPWRQGKDQFGVLISTVGN